MKIYICLKAVLNAYILKVIGLKSQLTIRPQ